MEAKDLLTETDYDLSRKKYLQLIVRKKEDLLKYLTKDEKDQNKISIAIWHEQIEIMIDYANKTNSILELKEDLLIDHNRLRISNRNLLKEYEKLQKYAQSKGLDLSLLPHIYLRDR